MLQAHVIIAALINASEIRVLSIVVAYIRGQRMDHLVIFINIGKHEMFYLFMRNNQLIVLICGRCFS